MHPKHRDSNPKSRTKPRTLPRTIRVRFQLAKAAENKVLFPIPGRTKIIVGGRGALAMRPKHQDFYPKSSAIRIRIQLAHKAWEAKILLRTWRRMIHQLQRLQYLCKHRSATSPTAVVRGSIGLALQLINPKYQGLLEAMKGVRLLKRCMKHGWPRHRKKSSQHLLRHRGL